jgi:protein AbiQ
MDKLFFYEIDEKYIDFLSKFSEHLFRNARIGQAHSRKYVGILFEINGMKYFAPLSSFKAKHKRLSETLDFIKIGDMAVINLNAKLVYEHKITNDGKSKLSLRCSDFKLLEEKSKEYKA